MCSDAQAYNKMLRIYCPVSLQLFQGHPGCCATLTRLLVFVFFGRSALLLTAWTIFTFRHQEVIFVLKKMDVYRLYIHQRVFTILHCDFKNTVDLVDLGCVSLGESENGFVIPDHVDFSTPKKRKIRKRIILS